MRTLLYVQQITEVLWWFTTKRNIKEIERQLSDGDVCIPLQPDPTCKFSGEIKTVLKQTLQICEGEYKIMVQVNPVPCVIYFPKIQKSILNPLGRPIVSGNGSTLG